MELVFTVTNSQLLATKYVTLIFMGLLILGSLINIRQLIKEKQKDTRIRKAVFIAILGSLIYPVYNIYDVESSLLASDKYATGITTGLCEAFALGNGVEFKYTISGVTYTNCDAYHPISIDSIIVPDGKYYVRYADKYPEQGRIDLTKAVIPQDKDNPAIDNSLEAYNYRLTKPISDEY